MEFSLPLSLSLFYLSIYMSNYMYVNLCDVIILVIPDTPLVREANTKEDSLNFFDGVGTTATAKSLGMTE